MMNMEQAHPQPTIFDGELKSYQLKVDFIVMYLFTMAVISFLTNSDVFKLFFREWIGLSTSMNRYLLHVHTKIQQKWLVVFLFRFWKHDMTLFINMVNTFDFTDMCVLWYYGTCWDLQTEEDNNASLPTISAFMQN